MNRTKIETADYTWNPVTGCWGPGGTAEKPNRCFYCYAQKLIERFNAGGGGKLGFPFDPKFYPDRLSQPAKVKKPSKIFTCSMADLFGDWVPDEWIFQVGAVAHDNPQHIFQFLTKNPKRLTDWNPWPSNCWVGTTVTNQADADERLHWLLQVDASVRFVNHEPLLGEIDLQYPPGVWPDGPIYCCNGNECACQGAPIDPPLVYGISWAIIGSMTGPGAVKPKAEWVQGLIDQYRAAGVPMFVNHHNLNWPEKIQEGPG